MSASAREFFDFFHFHNPSHRLAIQHQPFNILHRWLAPTFFKSANWEIWHTKENPTDILKMMSIAFPWRPKIFNKTGETGGIIFSNKRFRKCMELGACCRITEGCTLLFQKMPTSKGQVHKENLRMPQNLFSISTLSDHICENAPLFCFHVVYPQPRLPNSIRFALQNGWGWVAGWDAWHDRRNGGHAENRARRRRS